MELKKEYCDERNAVLAENGNHYPVPVLADLDSRPAFNRFRDRLLPYVRSVNEAHLAMLSEQGILCDKEAGVIMRTLEGLDYEGYKTKEFTGEFEDLYFQMEKEIIDNSNGIGGNLHLGRSRNDMSVTWSRLGARKHILSVVEKLIHFQNTVRLFAQEHKETLYVIHTHTQHAQPGIFGHYYLGFLDVLDRCIHRFQFAYDATNVSPMGAAAATTTGFPISRERVCELLGFDRIIDCSYDAIASFDHFLACSSAIGLCALDLGRTVTDMLLWATEEERMIILADGYSSTSSIMPQKRNPIALEHLRASLSMVKALADAITTGFLKSPYGDISDHEDVEDTMDEAFSLLKKNIDVFNAVIATMDVNKKLLRERAYESFSVVTEIADEMYRSYGVPFRKAHGFVSFMVRKADHCKYDLRDISADFFSETYEEYFKAKFEGDFSPIRTCIDPERFVRIREITGGTGPKAMQNLLFSASGKVESNRAWYVERTYRLATADGKLKEAVRNVAAL